MTAFGSSGRGGKSFFYKVDCLAGCRVGKGKREASWEGMRSGTDTHFIVGT